MYVNNCLVSYSHVIVYYDLASSEHVKSSKLGGTLKSTFQAMKSMQLQGNVKQQGGQFVLGPGKVIIDMLLLLL